MLWHISNWESVNAHSHMLFLNIVSLRVTVAVTLNSSAFFIMEIPFAFYRWRAWNVIHRAKQILLLLLWVYMWWIDYEKMKWNEKWMNEWMNGWKNSKLCVVQTLTTVVPTLCTISCWLHIWSNSRSTYGFSWNLKL